MKKIILGALALVLIVLAGCTTITVPIAATANPVGSKVGEATETWIFGGSYSYFYSRSSIGPEEVTKNRVLGGTYFDKGRAGELLLFVTGDKSLSTAAANGGVSRIATVEQRIYTNPFIVKITTIVTGE